MIKELLLSVSLGVPTGIAVINYLDSTNMQKRKIKKSFQYLFEEKNLMNSKGNYPQITSIQLKNYGFIVILDIRKICSYGDIERLLEYVSTMFDNAICSISKHNCLIGIEVINNPIKDKIYEPIPLSEYELLLGFDLKGQPITINMKITPHMLISGLSGQGKSSMIKVIINNINTNANIVILNGFEEDYKGCKCVIGTKSIEDYLEHIRVNLYYKNLPIFIVLEEMQTFNSNKRIVELIKELLSIGRHFNIFIIGIIQIATKENCKFKDLFNARCSFKQIDSSGYSVCLGLGVQEQLQQREFYLYSTSLVKGKTYTI